MGLLCYAVFSGSPILLVAFLGAHLRNRYPQALSIGDFARWRYGVWMEAFTTALVLFFIGLALAVEYTTIGSLFADIYGINRMVPIICCFLVTMTYTTVGGVYVSIVTDQWQARFSLVLTAVAIVYMLSTFRPTELPPLPPYLALNEAGLGSIVTLGISFASTGIFNDAYWQRVWSSENDKALKTGAVSAFLMVTLVVFTFGFGGFLASWAGYVTTTDTAFFSILKIKGEYAPPWILILTTLLAVAMNESLVDSYQNALTDSAVSLALSCGIDIPLSWARVLTLLMNVPVVLIGLQGYNVNSLFLVACLATTMSCLPIILGLVPVLDRYIHQSTALFGCLFSFFLVTVYGWIVKGSWTQGIRHCFWESWYWQVFLLAFGGCFVGIFVFVGLEALWRRWTGIPFPPFKPHHKLAPVDKEDMKEEEKEESWSLHESDFVQEPELVLSMMKAGH